jgi:DNA-binding transcriptional regulator YbjK
MPNLDPGQPVRKPDGAESPSREGPDPLTEEAHETPGAELSKEREPVDDVPVFDDLTVAHVDDVHHLEGDGAPGRGDAHQVPQVGAPECLVRCHPVTVAEHAVDGDSQVGKAGVQHGELTQHAVPVVGRSRVGRPVPEVRGKQLLANLHAPLPLELLDKALDDFSIAGGHTRMLRYICSVYNCSGGIVPPINTQRRNQICDAAIEVLAHQGLRGLTHRAVDAAAYVPTGTTSRYYRSREALLRGVVDRMKDVQFAKLSAVELHRVGPAHLAGAIADLARDVLVTDRSQHLAMNELMLEGSRRPYLRKVLSETSVAFEELLVALCRKGGVELSDRDALLLVMLSNGIVLTSLTTRPEAQDHLRDLVETGVERILGGHL